MFQVTGWANCPCVHWNKLFPVFAFYLFGHSTLLSINLPLFTSPLPPRERSVSPRPFPLWHQPRSTLLLLSCEFTYCAYTYPSSSVAAQRLHEMQLVPIALESFEVWPQSRPLAPSLRLSLSLGCWPCRSNTLQTSHDQRQLSSLSARPQPLLQKYADTHKHIYSALFKVPSPRDGKYLTGNKGCVFYVCSCACVSLMLE